MEAYKVRLIAEHDDLMLRIQKLKDYMDNLKTESYEGQFYLLFKQYMAMSEYCLMLEYRADKEDIDLNAIVT